MELTDQNFQIYAAMNYDNMFCLNETEFLNDLGHLKTIQRMMTKYIKGDDTNIRLLINNIIIFYNCFKHSAASKMIQLKVSEEQIQYFNAVLKFLCLPLLIPPETINDNFYEILEQEFR